MKNQSDYKIVLFSLIISIFLFIGGCTSEKGKMAETLFDKGELDAEGPIKYIDLVHCSHTDYGFTDHPMIAQELQRRFLDIAVDAAILTKGNPKNEQFRWSAEALDVVKDWWEHATPERQDELLASIRSGQIAINALPFHIHPFINERQWKLMTNWVPDDLWAKLQPSVGMQHDVNGFPRSAAIGLLDKGVNYLWTGINDHFGGAPFKPPYAFWWKMPDDRKILVWLGFPYWEGYLFFAEQQWRSSQREANNTQFWSPRPGDMLMNDEASVIKAHEICTRKIEKMISEGYPYDFITVSITNQWRIDNDGPFIPLVNFVKKWNELGLKPRLNLKTVDVAMKRIENQIGDKIDIHTGEWLDWWSFGVISNPRELSASRQANNFVEAAISTVFGPSTKWLDEEVDQIDRWLCRYYEHTFGSNVTLSDPYSFFNLGQLNEKASFAYRPYEKAKWLLARRIQAEFSKKPEGLYVINSGKAPYTGWIYLDPVSFRRQKFLSIENTVSGNRQKLFFDKNGARFWVDLLGKESFSHFLLKEDSIPEIISSAMPLVKTDKKGWPVEVTWNGMEKPLFIGGFGDFVSLQSKIPRWNWSRIWHQNDENRSKRVQEDTEWISATPLENARKEETAYTIKYIQKIQHPRLNQAERILEIWKNEPRAKYNISFDRISSFLDEIFYVHFPLQETGKLPVTSNGGHNFVPYEDQLPGTSMDYFSIDGWIHYPSESGHWVWSSKEAAMVTFDGHQFCAKRKTAPENMNNLYAMIYNNVWEVNFPADCPGEMRFEFDLFWKKEISKEEIPGIVKTYFLPPLVIQNPKFPVDEIEFNRMVF
ncbi:MAG: hypothetical protein WC865_14210 [Bacteroidales bacterium]